VLICDEHDLVRRSLTATLEESQALEVVAEVAGGAEAVAESLRVAPDVVFVSLYLPDLAGTQTIGLICDVMPGVTVVALAVEESADERFDALRAGAFGVIDKEQFLESPAAAVERLLRGAPFLAAESAGLLLARFDDVVETSGVAPLTGRERSVLERVAEGDEPTAIGDGLQMVMGEVRNHMVNVLRRLQAGAPPEVVPEARELLATVSG
jgi:DNA-binding NarL/FixJ family response regulator